MKCVIRGTVRRGNVRSEKCHSRNCPSENFPTEKCLRETVRRGNAMLCYVMWNLFTVGSLQFCNDSTITSLEANHFGNCPDTFSIGSEIFIGSELIT